MTDTPKTEFNGTCAIPQKTQFHIFIDLDGVVADFDAHATAHGKFKENGTPKWNELDLAWWESMPVCKGARFFYDEASRIGETRFLTAPILSEDCYVGKVRWVQKFLPELGKAALKKLIIAPSKDKEYLAGPTRILVDDRAENVEAWIKAGGIGIHHKGDFAMTLKLLRAATGETPALARKRDQGPAR